MSDDGRPRPDLTGSSGEFYGFCRQGELRFQRCLACGTWRHVPREMCAHCGGRDHEWARSSGRGVVFSWTVVERALHPAFADETPYAPVIVEMEEGVRVLSRLADVPPSELEIGLPVEVCFERLDDAVTLPRFRRVRS